MTDIHIGDDFYPAHVALKVTRKCNMRCLHCGSSANENDQDHHFNFDEWCRIITDLKKLGTKCFYLIGGEPTLYPKWKEIIQFIRSRYPAKKKQRIGMITNGWLLDKANIVFLKEYEVDPIGISLDGDETIHDYIRQTPGSFKRIIENIKMCLDYELPVSIISSINKINFPIREALVEVVLKSGVARWQIQIVNSFGRAGTMKDHMLIDQSQHAQLTEDIVIWKEKYTKQIRITVANSIGCCH